MENMTGQVIKAYEIREQIGAGGFGAVYLAEQPSVGRAVAVKIILPQHANQPEFIRRFESEAQIIARLEHPHIVPLYDYWRDPSGAFLVMRYLNAGSLRESLHVHGAWQGRDAVRMINQISAALTFAHRNGVIHRDLKSDNILLDETGNTYLSDFGIAKDLGQNVDLTQDNILGTPAYLAPEQIRGEAPSPQSDIYALGILAYETLTGSKPFYDSSPAALLYKQLNEDLPNITDMRPDLSPEVNIALQRATAKDAEMRYQTALDFARDLQSTILMTGMGDTGIALVGDPTMDIMSVTQAEAEIFEPKNPFKGLRAFQQADAKDFFGRDELIERLRLTIAADGSNADFLAVVGPSGSGKSSVVKAGLLPRIQEGVLNPEKTWFTAEMIPGTHPMEELEAALLAIASSEMPGLLEQLREDERGLVRAIKRLLPDEHSEFVLFIDQFEETFTLVDNEEHRAIFLDSIVNAVKDIRSRIKIIITIRADFYDRPLFYNDFGELIRQHTELVLPFSDGELRKAISGPADRAGVILEPGLVETIVSDVHQQPGALPMMQYALTELFERRTGRKLTLDAYYDIGGTTGALARRADEIFISFNDAQQSAARQMFLRLVSLGEGTEDTRRRIFQDELLSVGQQAAAMRSVIDTYGKYRLLTFDHDPQTRRPTLEVAHEALIRQWSRLRVWLDESREALRQQRRLSNAALDWQQSAKDPSFLARGTRLTQFEEWSDRSNIALNQIESQFLSASIQAREDRFKAEREQEALQEKLRQAARQRLQLLAGLAIVAAVVGITLAVIAITSRQSAVEAREQALAAAERADAAAVAAQESADLAAEREQLANSFALAANARNALTTNNDPQLALTLALAANEAVSPAPAEIIRTLATAVYAPGPRHRFIGHEGSVLGVEISRDGLYTLSGSVDGTIRLWSNNTGEQEVQVRVADIRFNDVAIHPTNESFVGAATDGNLYLYDLDGNLLDTFEAHEGEVRTVTYSPDGLFLLSAGDDKTARQWGLASRSLSMSFSGHSGVITRAVYNADGTIIVTASADETLTNDQFDEVDRTVRVWSARTGNPIQVIQTDAGFVRSLDIHPNGDVLAYGTYSNQDGGTIRIVNTESGEEVRRFFVSGSPLTDIAFSPDGARLVSVGWDQNVRVYDMERGSLLDTYAGFDDRILSLDYAEDGKRIALGIGNVGDNEFEADRAVDQSIWLWDITGNDQITSFEEHNDWVWAVDISPDGTLSASAGGPFNLSQPVLGAPAPDNDTSIYIWNTQTGEIVQELIGHSNTVDSVQFHPNGEWILSAAWDEFIILWDLASGERLNIYREHVGKVYWVRFNAAGDQFLSAGADGQVLLWDTETGEILRRYEGHPSAVNAVRYNADESLIATASGNFSSDDFAIRIFEADTGELLRTITGHTSLVHEVLFHPSKDEIVSTSWDGTVQVWDLNTGESIRSFSGHTGHTFGLAFNEDGSILLTTAEDATVRMWNYETAEELHRFSEHTNWVLEVVISDDFTFALSAAEDDTAKVWRLDTTASALADFARETRYIREFSCDVLEPYRIPCTE